MKKYSYISLPNRAVQTHIDRESGEITNSYCSIYGVKILLIFIYFCLNKSLRETCNFTLEDLIISCGYNCNKSTTKTFLNLLNFMSNELNPSNKKPLIEFITKDNIKLKNLIKIKTNFLEYDSEKDDYCYFVKITDDEREKILNYDEKGVDNNILFAIYCNLKSRMQERYGNTYKGKLCYPSYQRICQDVGCSEPIITKYINILQDLKLIIINNTGTFKHLETNTIIEANNTYFQYDTPTSGIHHFIEEMSELYVAQKKAKGFKLLKEIDDRINFKKIGGEKGRIKRLIKEGRAKESDIKRLEEIENILNENKYKYTRSKNIEEIEEYPEEYKNNINEAMEDLNIIDFWGKKISF